MNYFFFFSCIEFATGNGKIYNISMTSANCIVIFTVIKLKFILKCLLVLCLKYIKYCDITEIQSRFIGY